MKSNNGCHNNKCIQMKPKKIFLLIWPNSNTLIHLLNKILPLFHVRILSCTIFGGVNWRNYKEKRNHFIIYLLICETLGAHFFSPNIFPSHMAPYRSFNLLTRRHFFCFSFPSTPRFLFLFSIMKKWSNLTKRLSHPYLLFKMYHLKIII